MAKPSIKARASGIYEELKARPFVREVNEPVRRLDLWSVEPTGDLREDNRFGERCARAVIDHMKTSPCPLLLQNVVAAMITKGRAGGVEVGFLQTIGFSLVDAA